MSDVAASRGRGIPWLTGALALAALLVPTLLLVLAPTVVLPAYVFALMASLNVALGALGLLLINGLTGGRWGRLLAPVLAEVLAVLPWFALLMLPLWFHLELIFPWAGGEAAHLMRGQPAWLQPGWHMARTGFYLLSWLVIAAAAGVWSRRVPHLDGGPAAAGLILFVITVSLFAVDWIMALATSWGTSMVGALLLADQFAAALALASLGFLLTCRDRPKADTGAANRDNGNLLLGAVMFHGYCLFMDYLIVWQGNLPGEIDWYLRRTQLLGLVPIVVALILAVGLPVLLLLFRPFKASRGGLASVCISVLAGHLLLIYWYLAPVMTTGRYEGPHWLLTWGLGLVLIGLWVALGLALAQWRRGGKSIDAGQGEEPGGSTVT